MQVTPLLENASRILVHARGRMIPSETDFWQRLRFDLRELGLDLFIVSHYDPEQKMNVPYIKVTNGLDSGINLPEQCRWGNWVPPHDGLNETFLLEREQTWRGTGVGTIENVESIRRKSLYNYKAFYAGILKSVKPSLTVIWSGEHPQELILAELCRDCGCHLAFIERAPFQGMLQFDRNGILAGSSAAFCKNWKHDEEIVRQKWLKALDKITSNYLEKGTTWWEQPEAMGPDKIKEKFGIPPNAKVILFAGQVDEDAQNFLFSPHFSGTLEAFDWFCANLPKDHDLFVLGKHHPKSSTSIDIFSTIVKGRGVWTNKASLEDCLAVADYVATVNSTVMYEAIMKKLPVLSLGKSLLSGKQIVHELTDLNSGAAVISDWLEKSNSSEHIANWREFASWLLANSFYSMRSENESFGLLGTKELSAALDEWQEKAKPDYSMIPADNIPPDSITQNSQKRSMPTGLSRWTQKFLGMPQRILYRAYSLCTQSPEDNIFQILRRNKESSFKGALSGKSMLVVSHVPFWRVGNGTTYRLQGLLSGLASHGLEIHVLHLGVIAKGEVTPENLADLGIAGITVVPNWQAGCRGAQYYNNDHPSGGKLRSWYLALRGIPLIKRLPAKRQFEDYQNPSLCRIVAQISRSLSIDFFLLVYTYMYSLTKYVPSSCVTIVDTIDVLHMRQASFEAGAQKPPVLVSRKDESAALAHFDIIVAIQNQEAEVLRSMVSSCCKVVTCYPALLRKASASTTHKVIKTTCHKILYVASNNNANIDGLNDLFNIIWPEVIKSCPDAELEVCGSVCNGFNGTLPHGTVLRGFVPDLAEVYSSATLVVNPVQVGAGLKIKVLEGLEYGCPVVATEHAVEGFPDITDSGIVVVHEFSAFAGEIVKLLKDPVQRLKLGSLAAEYVQSKFSIDDTVDGLVSEMKRQIGLSQK